MPYLTEAQLAKRHSVPVALALTLLKKSDWILLNTIKLSSTMTFTYKFLQLQLVDVTIDGTTGDDPCDVPDPILITPTRGLAYVAIYKNYGINTDPSGLTFTGSSVDLVSIPEAGIASRDITKAALVLNEVANFTFLLVNNTTNADLRLAVNGEVLITL